MSPRGAATVSVLVAVDPATAFAVFTEDVDAWWKRGPAYRFGEGGVLRFEPGVGGRLVQVFDDATGESWEVGRIRTWEPGRRLTFAFRIPNFAPDESTEVDVRFEAEGEGTRVTLEHRGWEGLPMGHPARHGLDDDALAVERGQLWLLQLRALARCAARGRPGPSG